MAVLLVKFAQRCYQRVQFAQAGPLVYLSQGALLMPALLQLFLLGTFCGRNGVNVGILWFLACSGYSSHYDWNFILDWFQMFGEFLHAIN